MANNRSGINESQKPIHIDPEEWESRFDMIFKRGKKNEQKMKQKKKLRGEPKRVD